MRRAGAGPEMVLFKPPRQAATPTHLGAAVSENAIQVPAQALGGHAGDDLQVVIGIAAAHIVRLHQAEVAQALAGTTHSSSPSSSRRGERPSRRRR